MSAPTVEELRGALASGRAADALRAELAETTTATTLVDLHVGASTVPVPVSALRQVIDLLEDLSEGRRVTIAPADLPVGTQVAAAVLGVSRPWITRLLDRGEIPATRSGSKRRVALGDLIAHRRHLSQRQREAISNLEDHIEQEAATARHTSGVPSSPRRPGFFGRIKKGSVPQMAEASLSGHLTIPIDDFEWAA